MRIRTLFNVVLAVAALVGLNYLADPIVHHLNNAESAIGDIQARAQS